MRNGSEPSRARRRIGTSAGTISLGAIESTPIDDFVKQYGINVRAPYLLTQALLPLVKLSQGEIVFINSSAGIHTKEQIGAYAASKHALRAIADTLRMEVNAFGVRVLSVYPGNTATAMQDAIQDFTTENDSRISISCSRRTSLL